MKPVSSTTKSPAHESVSDENTLPPIPARPYARASSSPRASVAYSFLFVVEWFRNKSRSFLRLTSWQKAAKQEEFDAGIQKGKCGDNRRVVTLLSIVFLLSAGGLAIAHNENQFVPRYQVFSGPEGRFANFNVGDPTDEAKNAFFKDLGTNGRRCVTCHQASDAWSVTPVHLRDRFNVTHGEDPIFRTNDGAGCPTEDVSTESARRSAYNLLLTKPYPDRTANP